MGAHTLGKADILNSGFHGMWVNNEQVLRDLHNKKKSVKFHTWGEGGLDKFGSFSHFFFTCSNSRKYEKKGIFCGGRGYHLTLKFWIFHR